jgi:hypothetical protein
MQWWIVAIVMGNLAFSAFILWLIFNYKLKRDRSQAEDRERLLSRFGTGPELLDFINSGSGDKLVRALAPQGKHPAERLGGAITGGLVTLCFGLAFLFLHWIGAMPVSPMIIPGTIMTFVGIGILVSVAVSASLLKRSGLLPRNGDGRGTDPL